MTLARKKRHRDAGASEVAQDERKHRLREQDDDREREERAERVDEVGPCELPRARQGCSHGDLLDDEDRNDEPERGQPCEPREDEAEHEERNRGEHEPADEPAPRRAAGRPGVARARARTPPT